MKGVAISEYIRTRTGGRWYAVWYPFGGRLKFGIVMDRPHPFALLVGTGIDSRAPLNEVLAYIDLAWESAQSWELQELEPAV